MSDLSKAVVRAGIVDTDMLKELSHWKLPVTVPEEAPFGSAAEAVAAIEDAQTEDAQVQVRVTDPYIEKKFEANKKTGRLKVYTNEEVSQTFGWEYSTFEFSDYLEYILPWAGNVSTELLVNGQTHLITEDKRRVYFTGTQSVYVGDELKFVVCTPRK